MSPDGVREEFQTEGWQSLLAWSALSIDQVKKDDSEVPEDESDNRPEFQSVFLEASDQDDERCAPNSTRLGKRHIGYQLVRGVRVQVGPRI